MEYPKDLLPRRYFRIFLLNELPKDSNYWLVRRSELPDSETFDRLGLLNVKAVIGLVAETGNPNVKEVAGLSLNLLGGYFKAPHIRFRPFGLAMKDWDPAKGVEKYSVIKNHIKLEEEESVPIYYRLEDLHNRTFPFTRNFDPAYKKKLPLEFQTRVGVNAVNASTEIAHKPTNANFWHAEFHVRDKLTGELLSRKKISTTDAANPQGPQQGHSRLALSALENILIRGHSSIGPTATVPCYVYVKLLWSARRFCRKILRPFVSPLKKAGQYLGLGKLCP